MKRIFCSLLFAAVAAVTARADWLMWELDFSANDNPPEWSSEYVNADAWVVMSDGTTETRLNIQSPDLPGYTFDSVSISTDTGWDTTATYGAVLSGLSTDTAEYSFFMEIGMENTPSFRSETYTYAQVAKMISKTLTTDFQVWNPGFGTWSAVPEPTSGVLMLVGMGLLALRRKRA